MDLNTGNLDPITKVSILPINVNLWWKAWFLICFFRFKKWKLPSKIVDSTSVSVFQKNVSKIGPDMWAAVEVWRKADLATNSRQLLLWLVQSKRHRSKLRFSPVRHTMQRVKLTLKVSSPVIPPLTDAALWSRSMTLSLTPSLNTVTWFLSKGMTTNPISFPLYHL